MSHEPQWRTPSRSVETSSDHSFGHEKPDAEEGVDLREEALRVVDRR